MGKRRISANDLDVILEILRAWPAKKRLTWEFLVERLREHPSIGNEIAWSRQALSANKDIRAAFAVAKNKVKVSNASRRTSIANLNAAEKRLEAVSAELQELKLKYDALSLRHTELMYNMSLLEGGSKHLLLPLPDNTNSQRAR